MLSYTTFLSIFPEKTRGFVIEEVAPSERRRSRILSVSSHPMTNLEAASVRRLLEGPDLEAPKEPAVFTRCG